jgi:hypothetical protein
VLRDPVKRKNYDLTFDNFSYKKEAHLEPHELLKKLMELRAKTGRRDPHRMDLDKLEFELTELLSERNTETLTNAPDKAIVQQFIRELLYAARPLTQKQYKPITDHVYPLADDATKEKIRQLQQRHAWDNRWNSYKVVFAIAAGILLCLLIYYVGR